MKIIIVEVVRAMQWFHFISFFSIATMALVYKSSHENHYRCSYLNRQYAKNKRDDFLDHIQICDNEAMEIGQVRYCFINFKQGVPYDNYYWNFVVLNSVHVQNFKMLLDCTKSTNMVGQTLLVQSIIEIFVKEEVSK